MKRTIARSLIVSGACALVPTNALAAYCSNDLETEAKALSISDDFMNGTVRKVRLLQPQIDPLQQQLYDAERSPDGRCRLRDRGCALRYQAATSGLQQRYQNLLAERRDIANNSVLLTDFADDIFAKAISQPLTLAGFQQFNRYNAFASSVALCIQYNGPTPPMGDALTARLRPRAREYIRLFSADIRKAVVLEPDSAKSISASYRLIPPNTAANREANELGILVSAQPASTPRARTPSQPNADDIATAVASAVVAAENASNLKINGKDVYSHLGGGEISFSVPGVGQYFTRSYSVAPESVQCRPLPQNIYNCQYSVTMINQAGNGLQGLNVPGLGRLFNAVNPAVTISMTDRFRWTGTQFITQTLIDRIKLAKARPSPQPPRKTAMEENVERMQCEQDQSFNDWLNVPRSRVC
jgi:hypothetical protein